ncbi:kinase-like domain-containing protein, partial [Hyaloraphidium curvatum]
MAGGGEPGGLPPPGKAGGAGRARTRSAGAALAPPAPAPAVPARPANLDTQAALPAAPHSSASLGRQGGSGGAGGAGSPGTGTPRSPDSPAAVDRFGSLRRFGKRDDADSEHQQLITRISGRSRKEEYKVIREIGFGSRAVVKEAIHLPTSLSCALKCIKKPLPLTPALSTQLSATQQEFVREVEVLRNHPHENICGFLDAFETRGKFVVAMELCRGGTVLERVEQMGHYPEAEAAYCIATVLNAVNFLHSLGIAHRDLKPQNLLYVLPIGNPLPEDSYAAAASLLKICDFGVAGIMARGMSTLIGTPFYLAPEILGVIGSDKKVPQGAGYGVLVDMWSLGCTAYCMLVGQNPFQDCTDFDVLFRRIREARYTPIPAHLGLSPAAESFIRSLLCSNPRDRLTAQQALEHPWI